MVWEGRQIVGLDGANAAAWLSEQRMLCSNVTIKLGVVALAGPDNGGTYQYTLSMLQALQHTSGFEITLYGDPRNPDFVELGYPIVSFAESRVRQLRRWPPIECTSG